MREVIITCDRCGERCGEGDLHEVQAFHRNEKVLHSPRHKHVDGEYWPFEICIACFQSLMNWANEKAFSRIG